MRDRLLNDALKRLAADAAVRFSGLVATGDQIPFDVAEQSGPDSLFYRYVPLTSRYVREREDELRTLPTFAAARDAVEAAELAVPYLEARGEPVPAESGERAAGVLTLFIASLWDGCSEFSLDRERLDEALAALDAEARSIEEADLLVAPIVGLRMSAARLQLPHGVRIVRADTVDAPIEAMRSEGMERAAWEPQFLALADQSGPDGPAEALRQLRELISVMRLFKRGGVGLGPHAFALTGNGQWRRLATGAPATRPGGYELNEAEAAELVALATALEARPDPDGALAWAVGRFEMGCERVTALEGLSDHLLALRSVLDGRGPVGASLPMRAAALIADETHDRIRARERVEHALELERSLMNGTRSAHDAELANWVEGGVRIMLRNAALGEIGADITAVAEDTLIASGLDAGDTEIAVTVQPTEEPQMPAIVGEDMGGIDSGASSVPDRYLIPSGPDEAPVPFEEDYVEQETRIMEPIPVEGEIKITATPWLDEVSVEVEASTLDFPAVEGEVEHRERIDSPRVRHLFPVPEDADWEVRELNYDHYRNAG